MALLTTRILDPPERKMFAAAPVAVVFAAAKPETVEIDLDVERDLDEPLPGDGGLSLPDVAGDRTLAPRAAPEP